MTVYRSLHLLEDMHLVTRYDFGDGVARFEIRDCLRALGKLTFEICYALLGIGY